MLLWAHFHITILFRIGCVEMPHQCSIIRVGKRAWDWKFNPLEVRP